MMMSKQKISRLWKDIHNHKRTNCTSSISLWTKILVLKAIQITSERTPRRKALEIIEVLLTTKSAMREQVYKETPVFIMNVKASKPPDETGNSDIDMAKVNTDMI